jgi:xylan 1,4-beta-xylosidase
MGRPAFPSRSQIEQLRAAGRLADPQQVAVRDDRLAVDIPPQGLVVVEIPATNTKPANAAEKSGASP